MNASVTNLFRFLFIPLSFGVSVMAQDVANIEAGKQSYDSRCQSCHGVAGASAIPTQPILAGQHANYLRQETIKFRDGKRKNSVMSAMAAGLSDADINNISYYLSTQKPVIAGSSDEEKAKEGEALYRLGESSRGIPACTACHGPTGAGIVPNFPRISGQHATYVASALRNFANKSRQSVKMSTIANRLSEEEIEQLASYISGLSD